MMTFPFKILNSTPKAKRTELSLDVIIVIGLAVAVFYFAKKYFRKIFPNVDEEVENIVTIAI